MYNIKEKLIYYNKHLIALIKMINKLDNKFYKQTMKIFYSNFSSKTKFYQKYNSYQNIKIKIYK